MNPSGLRYEEKKTTDHPEDRSLSSYKSTQSSRSSVLQRARDYNRRIDEQNMRRSKSLERGGSDAGGSTASSSRRSLSAGRAVSSGSRLTTRERAMQSVRKDTSPSKVSLARRHVPSTPTDQTVSDSYGSAYNSSPQTASTMTPIRPVSSQRPSATTTMEPYYRSTSATPTKQPVQQQQPRILSPPSQQATPQPRSSSKPSQMMNRTTSSSRTLPAANLTSSSPSPQSVRSRHSESAPQQQAPATPGVSPELLVDALSGHEDGLLAIAERLMEHYDQGYDVMGEAIFDAFADVQKLFQHVVEAAHMEGAAFEASRRDEELQELRLQVANGGVDAGMMNKTPAAASPGGSLRMDEFVDQDVKDVLTDAIRKGTQLRDAGKHHECVELYERACVNASSLLPVDSENRGRLQLSLARAESMTPDRACAILRYSMDDVLRSGLKAGRTPLPDLSKRSDVVLIRPSNSMVSTGHAGALQSADEALNSLIEEMKEILSAPVYEDTPLQAVAQRFWAALHDTQKLQQKNEDKLEQQLAKLKGEFLLAKSVSTYIVSWLCFHKWFCASSLT